jgi:hypothetical protein
MFAFLPRCEASCPRGALTALPVGELRPTQDAVGMDEVRTKAAKIKAMSPTHLEDYLLQRPIPVVIGNADQYYMIDHHHLARALWDAGKGDVDVPVLVAENWSPLHGDHFWKAMARHDWVYPFDGMGAGPTPPGLLKQHVAELDNDLYRSLAWYVRDRYGYIKDPSNPIFAEFKWASFFRSRVVFWSVLMKWKGRPMDITLADIAEMDRDEYDEKLAFAQYLAGAPEASGLPGFIGRRC